MLLKESKSEDDMETFLRYVIKLKENKGECSGLEECPGYTVRSEGRKASLGMIGRV